jgi:hypothetical protein
MKTCHGAVKVAKYKDKKVRWGVVKSRVLVHPTRKARRGNSMRGMEKH